MSLTLAFLKPVAGSLVKAAGALAGLCNLLPGWLWAAALAGSLLHGCVIGHQRDSARADLKALQQRTLAETIERTELARRAEADRRERAQVFEAAQAAINQKEADEKRTLAADVERLRGELRKRPGRPAAGGAVPGGAAPAVACTGAGLYREDAGFLVGESARADRIRIELARCRQLYDQAVTLTRVPRMPALPAMPSMPTTP